MSRGTGFAGPQAQRPRGAEARGSKPACAGLDGRQGRSVSRAAACKASRITRSRRRS